MILQLTSWASPPRLSPAERCVAPRPYLLGDAAFVVCFEKIGGDHLIATTYFIREDGRWKMIHHQAGPTRFSPPADSPQTGRSIH